ncbi:MAG: biotin--[acetyl-CoA-carboxylase] ligase [Clostridia bacterium]|nr:biotin--[acetyl-CoA-carboxylase] ligase [Clostridia bacterium]
MKEYIQRALLEHSDGYVTGSALCKKFGVTRAAVWKVMEELRTEGWQIEAVSGKGYRLKNETAAALSKVLIEVRLEHSMWNRIMLLDKVDSTNTYLKRLAEDGAEEGTAVIALRQTQGRGRRGRNWASNPGGIYLSFLFQPQPAIPLEQVPVMSLAVAMAAYKAILQVANVQTGIKWPNDVIYKGRKMCGILSELCGGVDTGIYCVAGIGINVEKSVIPEELQEHAVSLEEITGTILDKNELAAQMLKEMEWEYRNLDTCVQRYAEICVTVGKEVSVIGAAEEFKGTAIGVSDGGGLIVRKEDGTETVVSSGEVSVRGIYGYV